MDKILYALSYNAGVRFIEDGGQTDQMEELKNDQAFPEAFRKGVKDCIDTLFK
jgi:hypothetical protein